jgi:hypothetical protein
MGYFSEGLLGAARVPALEGIAATDDRVEVPPLRLCAQQALVDRLRHREEPIERPVEELRLEHGRLTGVADGREAGGLDPDPHDGAEHGPGSGRGPWPRGRERLGLAHLAEITQAGLRRCRGRGLAAAPPRRAQGLTGAAPAERRPGSLASGAARQPRAASGRQACLHLRVPGVAQGGASTRGLSRRARPRAQARHGRRGERRATQAAPGLSRRGRPAPRQGMAGVRSAEPHRPRPGCAGGLALTKARAWPAWGAPSCTGRARAEPATSPCPQAGHAGVGSAELHRPRPGLGRSPCVPRAALDLRLQGLDPRQDLGPGLGPAQGVGQREIEVAPPEARHRLGAQPRLQRIQGPAQPRIALPHRLGGGWPAGRGAGRGRDRGGRGQPRGSARLGGRRGPRAWRDCPGKARSSLVAGVGGRRGPRARLQRAGGGRRGHHRRRSAQARVPGPRGGGRRGGGRRSPLRRERLPGAARHARGGSRRSRRLRPRAPRRGPRRPGRSRCGRRPLGRGGGGRG